MKEYIPQIIATGIVILLNPASKLIFKKLIHRYGVLGLKSEARILQVSNIVAMLINATCIIALTIIWGVEPKHMLVALSSVFAVVGVALFAQWSILSNITAGIILFFSMPYHIGDRIKILDKDMPIEATIENIYTFSIHLRTEEGELVVLSNSLFLQKTVLVKENNK